MILMCDFAGYKLPEIIKKRPVVVISPNHMRRPGLVTVVPFSTTPPERAEAWHIEMLNHLRRDGSMVWAKCDCVATVCYERLDRVMTSKRRYEVIYVSKEELQHIRNAAAISLGIDIN